MVKAARMRALIIKVNLAFLAIFLCVYFFLLLGPATLDIIRGPRHGRSSWMPHEKRKIPDEAKPRFLQELHKPTRIALVNIGDPWWPDIGPVVEVRFDRVSESLEWKGLFPEWIDEEEENGRPSCPEIPMPDLSGFPEVDMVVVGLPCRYLEEGWRRDVWRLQVHLVAATVAARKGRRDGKGRVRVAARSPCRPMLEMFRCDDVAGREGQWWLLEVEAWRLEEKLRLPVGSCELALPLRKEGGGNGKYDHAELLTPVSPTRREAYATVIHSSDHYTCGAIALAQSLLATGTQRDLILLHDNSIPSEKLAAMAASGWQLRLVNRIRNPHGKNGSYNEYNYTKFRLWLLTSYSKVVFVDSDVVVLQNLDVLFLFPQLTATGNNGFRFNSGVMVIEPSNCTFRALMGLRHKVSSYNGGDQGFLNEVFVWWHRLPRRVNFLKYFWANTSAETATKNHLFAASEPPLLYSIHYLGTKPWQCYRDYDCNWDVPYKRKFASDVAHARWWAIHDRMPEALWRFCGLSEERKIELERVRGLARKAASPDQHWRINVTDSRKFE